MTNEKKIALADLIISFISENADSATKDEMPIMVGTLTKRTGLVGFKSADIGHPVFEHKDRYVMYFESLDGKTTVAVTYYKDTLKDFIHFTHL